MHKFPHVARCAGACTAGHEDIDAAAHADQKSSKQRDEYGSGANRTERRGTGKTADNGNVGHVEKYL